MKRPSISTIVESSTAQRTFSASAYLNAIEWHKLFNTAARALACTLAATHIIAGVPLIVPPEPPVKPATLSFWELDKDGNLIDDVIDKHIADAQAVLSKPDATPKERAYAQQVLADPMTLTFLFSRQLTLAELEVFVHFGGDVLYIYEANYGWVGSIARGKVPATVAQMRPGFVGVLAGGVPVVVPQELQVKPSLPRIPLIEDTIVKEISEAQAILSIPGTTPDQRSEAHHVLNQPEPFAFSFSRQITIEELNAFAQLGGVVTYIFQANYGWTGIIDRGRIPQVVDQMKPGFLGVVEGKPMTLHMPVGGAVVGQPSVVPNPSLPARPVLRSAPPGDREGDRLRRGNRMQEP